MDARRSPRRKVAREQRDRGETERNDAVRRDVSRVHTEEKRGHEPGEKESRHDAERDAESGQFRAISKDETAHVSWSWWPETIPPNSRSLSCHSLENSSQSSPGRCEKVDDESKGLRNRRAKTRRPLDLHEARIGHHQLTV